jgi:hypothetical protein
MGVTGTLLRIFYVDFHPRLGSLHLSPESRKCPIESSYIKLLGGSSDVTELESYMLLYGSDRDVAVRSLLPLRFVRARESKPLSTTATRVDFADDTDSNPCPMPRYIPVTFHV